MGFYIESDRLLDTKLMLVLLYIFRLCCSILAAAGPDQRLPISQQILKIDLLDLQNRNFCIKE